MTTEKHTTVSHPLEPLTEGEIRAAVDLLQSQGDLDDGYMFASVNLHEPPKERVLDFREGDPIDREAFAVLLDKTGGSAYEAVVSLTEEKVRSWKHIPGAQPPIMQEEIFACEWAVKAHPEFREALRKRGVTNLDLVMLDPLSAGHYGDEEGRRLLRALAWVRAHPEDNGYAHPIDNVVAVFDLNKMEVVRIEDHGVVPVPEATGNYTPEAVGGLRTDLKR
jgi:primary-amine oxidase